MYYKLGINKNIKSLVNICDKCYQIKSVCYKLYREPNILHFPQIVFTDLTINFIIDMPLLKFHNIMYNSIFMVIYCYTILA